MRYKINNDIIKVEIDSYGAEVKSVIKNGTEYMWNGDPKYWGRTSPVLFPFVGSVNNGKYKVDGVEYQMRQHGFARDMEFELTEQSDTEISFVLMSNEETLKEYPFEFKLCITYTIVENVLTVNWTVENIDTKQITFSIGAHPAFMCPVKEGKQTDYMLRFDTLKNIDYYLLDGPLVNKERKYMLLNLAGYVDIKEGMFDNDALVVENKQAGEISLCYPDGKAYVTVKTDAQLFGLWSPAKKNAPFICIEPWYGRCDTVGFDGDITQREYSNNLAVGELFEAEYTVEFN